MTHAAPNRFCPSYAFDVIDAAAFRVIDGVNHGEPVGLAQSLCLGDSFALKSNVMPGTLTLDARSSPNMTSGYLVSQGSAVGPSGAEIVVPAKLTFMSPIGVVLEALLFHTLTADAQIYLHPLGPVSANLSYTLIKIETDPKDIPVADMTAMSFGRGTRITMADGRQRRVETLRIGERVLTRDGGIQRIRWVGAQTVQAVGGFAPVVITAGVLGNAEAMTVGQQHRMLVTGMQAEGAIGAREALICAGDLVNGDTIYLRSGGFADYTQLVFDRHEVIYAEGIPTESLNPSPRLLHHMPGDVLTGK